MVTISLACAYAKVRGADDVTLSRPRFDARVRSRRARSVKKRITFRFDRNVILENDIFENSHLRGFAAKGILRLLG